MLATFAAATSLSTAGPTISEFMADNETTLADADGEFPDWIEISNFDQTPVELAGYHLTDDPAKPDRWGFPPITLQPGERIVVFASGKDRTDPASELHTDFRLDADGGYLALVAPDGVTTASEFAPAYPPQFEDQSYGAVGVTDLVAETSTAHYHIPSDGSLALTWTTLDFDHSSWSSGPGGFGWESPGGPLEPLIATDLRDVMRSENGGAFVRFAFTAGISTDPIQVLSLKTRIDDGYIAYLNGVEVARENAPASAAYDSTAPQSGRTDLSIAAAPQVHDLSAYMHLIQEGENVLAIHGLNSSPAGSDFLVRVALEADVESIGGPVSYGYLEDPSPGARNIGGEPLGPIFAEVTESPDRPAAGSDLTIDAEILANNAEVAGATLHYRTMWDAEMSVPMSDPDGDGIYSATIPGSAFAAGDMVRWRFEATDSLGNKSSEPPFQDPDDSHQYWGTVALDPEVVSNLTVIETFLQNPTGAESINGTRGAVFYLGELYDNVYLNRHGQSSAGFPKKSFNIDFNRTQRFRWHEDEDRVKDIDLLTNWADKSKVRHVLAYEIMREAGVHAHFAYTVRVQQNGEFFSTADLVEDADDIYLDRAGLNPEGALYKAYSNQLNAGQTGDSGFEKKNRRDEDNSDLTAFIAGLNAGTTADQWDFIYDNVNLPMMVNLLAAYCVIRNTDIHRKNWYIYRDTGRTDEWALLPWDLDLSQGRKWNSTDRYFDNNLQTHGYVQVGTSIRLISQMWARPEVREMVLRRIRTLSDRFLQPESTPLAERYYERRLDELSALIDPPAPPPSDARMDFVKWGSWIQGNGSQEPYTSTHPDVEDMARGIERFRDEYLPGRRNEIYNVQSTIPPAQTARQIDFGAIEFKPASGNQDEEYIQLVNNTPVAVDISGWRVAGAVEFDIPPGTVLPSGGTLYLSPDVNTFRARASSPTGGESNYVIGGYDGHLSSLGETIELLDADGELNNSTSYPGDPSAPQLYLVVSEIMYHPYGDGAAEYIEIMNASPDTALDLSGVRFTDGIDFDFDDSSISSLAPGARALVVRDVAAFEAAFGNGHPVAGVFANGTALDNGGEKIKIEDADNGTVREFDYSDDPPWPAEADGEGLSLILIDPLSVPDHDLPASWTAGRPRPGLDDPAGLVGDPTRDDDSDHLNALLEHALGTDDNSPSSGPGAIAVGANASGVTFCYQRNLAAAEVTFTVETTVDLIDWVDAETLGLTEVERINNGDGTEKVVVQLSAPPSGETARQFRLKVAR